MNVLEATIRTQQIQIHLPIIGGPPCGGGIIGAARPLPGKFIGGADTIPRPPACGIIAEIPGPPIPRIEPASPAGAPGVRNTSKYRARKDTRTPGYLP